MNNTGDNISNDPYEILGVNSSSSDADIKKAYRELAKKYHPDVNQGDVTAEEKFKKINDAYDKINTKEKRDSINAESHYDFSHWSAHTGYPDMDDYIDDFLRKRKKYTQQRNTDVFLNYRINLQDSYNGRTLTINYNIVELGKTVEKSLEIEIPKGVEDGKTICYSGKGNQENSQYSPGDLYITYHILEDSVFTRSGQKDLFHQHTITYLDALTGGNFEIDLLNGRKVRVKYNPMVSSETIMKMQECGMPYKNTFGDLFITFKIIPPKLTEEQINAIKNLRLYESF